MAHTVLVKPYDAVSSFIIGMHANSKEGHCPTKEDSTMPSWNQRNAQRATVKRPGTKEYSADYQNKNKQFFEKRTHAGCLSCGSTEINAKGGDGRLFIYCAHCGKQLKVINTKPTKVGNWSPTKKYRSRAGLCCHCGEGAFRGKMHLAQDHKHFVLTMTCRSCGTQRQWHNV